jgi:hypothetical protein
VHAHAHEHAHAFARVHKHAHALFNATFWQWISLRKTSNADVQTSNANM